MQCSVVVVVSLAIICLVSFAFAGKSHSILVTRVENLSVDDEWIGEHKAAVVKKDKNTKVFNGNFEIKQHISGESVKVEIKIYQQSGGKYVKAPLDFPKQSLCGFVESNEVIWPCIQESSNFPKRCPILKGNYWIKDLNPNNCNFGNTMPSHLPENYKAEAVFWVGLKPVLKMTLYGKLKKNMKI